jgi:hypothetical protein
MPMGRRYPGNIGPRMWEIVECLPEDGDPVPRQELVAFLRERRPTSLQAAYAVLARARARGLVVVEDGDLVMRAPRLRRSVRAGSRGA